MRRLVSLLLVLVFLVGLFPLGSAQATTYSEGFEDEELGETSPSEEGMTLTVSGAGSRFVTDAQAFEGTQSYDLNGFQFNVAQGDSCGETGVSFALRFTDATDSMSFKLSEFGGSTPSMTLSISATGVASLNSQYANGAGGTTTPAAVTFSGGGLTLVDNTWYHFVFRIDQCKQTSRADDAGSGRGLSYSIFESTTSKQASVVGSDTASYWCLAGFNAAQNQAGSFAACIDNGGSDLAEADNLAGTGVDAEYFVDSITGPVFSGVDSFGSSSTASVTNLVGFNVDPTGTTAVARTDGGKNVKTWDGLNLGTAIATVNTNCDLGFKEDAVMVQYDGNLVGFLNCDGTGDPQYFSIRDIDGSTPEPQDAVDADGETCTWGTGAGQCPYDIPLADFDEPADSSLGQIGQVKDFPISYANNDEESFEGADVRQVAWAFTSQDPDPGEVGLAMYTEKTGSPNAAITRSVNFASSLAEDWCVGLDDNNYYMAAVDAASVTKSWGVTFDTDAGGLGDSLDASIGSPNNFASAMGSAAGIDCGGGNVVLVTAAGTVYGSTRDGDVLWSITGVDAATRGVAISEEFTLQGESCTGGAGCYQYAAYLDETGTDTVHIVNVTDGGSEVATITPPSGSFHSMVMDRTAQNVWIATTTTIARFEVYTATTGGPVGSPCVENCDGGGGNQTSDTLFGAGPAALSSAFGLSEFGGNLFFAAITMAFTTGLSGFGAGRGRGFNMWGGLFGLVFGFVLAWALGFLSAGAVFVIVVLVAGASILFGVRAARSRS